MKRVVLKPRKARPFHGRHPWVLDSAIDRVEGEPADGDVVELVSDKEQWIARGLFNSQSRIRVRLYTWTPDEALDESFWGQRLARALALRERLFGQHPETAHRLVFSEADGLSGLVVDRYGDYLVLQVTSRAIAGRLEQIVPQLVTLVKPRGILLRGERGVAKLEGLRIEEGLHWGEAPAGPVFISEHGVRYGVDLTTGQKTGFFLDQRENRRAAAGYMRGLHVLDMFCYSGGFALCALMLGEASDVLGIDSSDKAVALAKANAELNGVSKARFEVGDGFQTLQSLADNQRRYGAVILDPPKFARTRGAADESLRAYHQLNRMAVMVTEPGGILVTCSCSGHVSREDFLHMLAQVAQNTGRDIQVIEQRGAAADHPVSATCLETEYLKCFICRVV